MGEQIVDGEHRVPLILADDEVDEGPVRLYHNPMHGQRHCHPLVLLYTAVIVRPKEREIHVFIERILFEIEAGSVNVGNNDLHALGKITAALSEGDDLFPSVHAHKPSVLSTPS